MGQETIQGKKNAIKKDISKTYNEYKEFEGKQYTGMKVGRGHKWYYDKGEWKEKKITPDKWEFTYAVNKRDQGMLQKAQVFQLEQNIIGIYLHTHQNVRKLDANNYTTSTTGLKYKLAHKRAEKEKWNTTDNLQRKRLIQILEELIVQLKREQVDAAK